MTALVHEVLRHRNARIRCEVLQRCAVRSRCRDNDRVLHCAAVFERLDDARDRRCLLTDGDVNADTVLSLLVQNRIDGDCRLARAAVADDQLALSAANRDERVDCLEPRLQRLVNALAVRDARCRRLDRTELLRVDGPLAVDRTTERVHNAADHRLAHGHLHDASRALHRVAFLDDRIAAEQNRADALLLEVQHETVDIVAEVQQLARHRLVQPVDMGNTVADLKNGADIVDVQIDIIVLDSFLDDGSNLFRIHFHISLSPR